MVKKALVRQPSPRLAEGIVTHIERQAVDFDLARTQWDAYVATLEQSGWEVVSAPPMDDCPDGVFIEDALLVYRSVAVITRPGAVSRRPEIDGLEPMVASLGYAVAHITEPGTLDGGDVLKIGDTLYVGRGGRTNREGIEQLRAVLAPLGASVVAVPIDKVLHLKSAVTALPDGTVIGFPPIVDNPSVFGRFLPMPEESGSHVVNLEDGRLLMASDCPDSASLVADLGYEPVIVDISEYEKLEGCVTCLSVRLRTAPR